MEIKRITDGLSVSPQVLASDMAAIGAAGFRAIICNRPDGEGADQPTHQEIAAAAREAGIEMRYLPVVPGKVSDADADAFGAALRDLPGPVLAFCRTGTRSATLWSLSEAGKRSIPEILAATKSAGYDMNGVARRIANGGRTPTDQGDASFSLVIIGAGAAGIAAASSVKARKPDLDIAIIDPADVHYYQPGWTMVGGGIFAASETARTMGSLIPRGVHWIKSAVAAFEPANNAIILDGCRVVKYDRLIVCPGLKLDWEQVEGLEETLGRNGVTSNYRYDLAPYTWELVQGMKSGRAIFTQPPMPIKCAGAPQKALYLSADAWRRNGRLKDIDIHFNNAGGVLFGVKDYVPALESYMDRYGVTRNFFHNLVAVDGPARKAIFEVREPDREPRRVETTFEMMHVCPPQTAPDFIRVSPLADSAGWVDVDQATLRHRTPADHRTIRVALHAPDATTAPAPHALPPASAGDADPAAEAAAMHQRHRRLRKFVQPANRIRRRLGDGKVLLERFLLERHDPLQIRAGLEVTPIAAQHDDARLRVRGDLAECGQESLDHVAIISVVDVRPIDRNRRHAATINVRQHQIRRHLMTLPLSEPAAF